jgi:hypothetical protein
MKRALLAALLLAGCTHVTTIRTEPQGALIYVNGVRLGSSPVEWETRSGFPGSAFAKAEKEGFVPARDVPIEKSYRADLSLLLLLPGILPYFFTARFEDEVVIHLEATTAPVPTSSR